MTATTSIEWTDCTWSPLRARRRDTGKVGQHCERVSAGCKHCYAARHNGRNLPNGGTGLDYTRDSRELVEMFVDERVLLQPLRWRKPRKIFVANQTDLFADFYTDEQRDRVFAVMALAPQHTFQVLTKRPERMREWVRRAESRARASSVNVPCWLTGAAQQLGDRSMFDAIARTPVRADWPLPNVWLGVSVEDQETADARIPLLLDTPAAVRFVSCEPLLENIDLGLVDGRCVQCQSRLFASVPPHAVCTRDYCPSRGARTANVSWRRPDWIIVGGESGPGARPCNIAWIRSTVAQCWSAGVACFVKQLGATPLADARNVSGLVWTQLDPDHGHGDDYCVVRLRDRKGGEPREWPADLRVREFPEARS